MHRAESYLIEREGQVARLTLPKRHRFVVLMPNDTPLIIPMDEPGTYEMDSFALRKDPVFPMLVMIVKAKHTRAFENMTREQAGATLRQAVSTAHALH
jgi:hypothetical protein